MEFQEERSNYIPLGLTSNDKDNVFIYYCANSKLWSSGASYSVNENALDLLWKIYVILANITRFLFNNLYSKIFEISETWKFNLNFWFFFSIITYQFSTTPTLGKFGGKLAAAIVLHDGWVSVVFLLVTFEFKSTGTREKTVILYVVANFNKKMCLSTYLKRSQKLHYLITLK